MIRTVVLFLFVYVSLLPLCAARSNGAIRLVLQPDGTQLAVRLMGDENVHWYQTIDGVILCREGDAYYVACINIRGEIDNSGILAHDAMNRSGDEVSVVESQDKMLFADAMQQTHLKFLVNYPSSLYCPHFGTVRVPVIMMNYKPIDGSDVHFCFDRSVYEEYFNGTAVRERGGRNGYDGYGSVSRFFSDASLGNLDMQFDLYGPYIADHEHDYYGSSTGNSSMLLNEAVLKADVDIDFTQYDSNGDGYVDMVYVLYAGTGANISGDDTDIWPACWQHRNISTDDGMTINIMGAANELATKYLAAVDGPLLAGVGVTAHEMSHGMGLPDLYRTLSSVPRDADGHVDYNNSGHEIWDLMDDGENLYSGIWPCTYTAWERDVMGWIELHELDEPANVTIYPLNHEKGSACRVTNPNNPLEYYVIENVETDGWNYYLSNVYGRGLMITHIRMTDSGLSMAPNNTYGEPNVSLVPADGFLLSSFSQGYEIMYRGTLMQMPDDYSEFQTKYFMPDIKGDLYPGIRNVVSVAAYRNYSGPSDMVESFPITDIKLNDDGSVSFKFMGGYDDTPTDVMGVTAPDNDAPIYGIDGRRVRSDFNVLPHGLYIQNGRLKGSIRR